MQQPESFIKVGKEHMVCKLNKGIYGLKQSGRVWHHTLKTQLEKVGFTSSNTDSTVYFRFGANGSIELSRWYVDDGLQATNSPQAMDCMITDIRGSFKIQDLGELNWLLGIQITRN